VRANKWAIRRAGLRIVDFTWNERERMNLFRKKSDREIVDSLRRVERYRRPLGVALMVFGLALGAVAFWVEWRVRQQLLKLADTISEVASGRHGPIENALLYNSALLAYVTGRHMGWFLCQSAVALGRHSWLAGSSTVSGAEKPAC
jgi:hypothetical protein